MLDQNIAIAIINDYDHRAYRIDKNGKMCFESGYKLYISAYGQLILNYRDGSYTSVSSGEISITRENRIRQELKKADEEFENQLRRIDAAGKKAMDAIMQI